MFSVRTFAAKIIGPPSHSLCPQRYYELINLQIIGRVPIPEFPGWEKRPSGLISKDVKVAAISYRLEGGLIVLWRRSPSKDDNDRDEANVRRVYLF
jgi:hypothetical protein